MAKNKTKRKRIARTIDPEKLYFRDIQIFQAHQIEGKTIQQTADEIGTSVDVVHRTKKKPAYNQLAQAALERANMGVQKYVESLVKLTQATKQVKEKGNLKEVPDNKIRLGALQEVGDIYGTKAPKEQNVRHSIAGASDAEISAELEESAKRLGMEEGPGKPEAD